MAFAAVDSVSGLKLLDQGVPKEKMAMLAIPLTPVQIILPVILAPYTTGDEPLKLWFKSYVPRLVVGGIFTAWVYFTPAMLQVNIISYTETNSFLGRVTRNGIFFGFNGHLYVSSIVHLCHVRVNYEFPRTRFGSIDRLVFTFQLKSYYIKLGGTYMTLLNTVCNLGGNWPATLALWAGKTRSHFCSEFTVNL